MRKKFGDSDGVITPYEEKRGKAIAKATGNPYKKGGSVKKKIPAGKKGKGLRALKKKAPQVAKRMGYKKGMKVK